MKGWDKIPGKSFFEAVANLFEMLDQYAWPIIQSIQSNQHNCKKIAAAMIHILFVQNEEQKEAKEIMRSGYFSIADCVRLLGYIPSAEEIKALEHIPFSKDLLKSKRRTHILVPVFGISMRTMIDNLGLNHCFDNRIEARLLSFFDTTNDPKASWQLVRIRNFAKQTDQPFEDQQNRLDVDEVVLSGQVMIYLTLLYYLATGEKLFGNLILRVNNSTSRNHHSTVSFSETGIKINEHWNGDSSPELVIATGIRPNG